MAPQPKPRRRIFEITRHYEPNPERCLAALARVLAAGPPKPQAPSPEPEGEEAA